MAKTPAEILRKTKQPNAKDDKGDGDKDDKPKRHNALIDFISKSKKAAAKS